MSNEVYANNMEIACKAGAGKSICSFPDVCFTPPQTPATPPGVPIPYPNTGMASDTTDGSKTVQISSQEVMLKNKSYFKRSTGDEAGCAPKKGVVTSTNMGKVYFTAWSMDVKIEGENAVRNLDLTTHNHNPSPGNTPPWMYIDSVAVPPPDHPCHDEINTAQAACKGSKLVQKGSGHIRICDEEGKCEKAMACILVPKGKDKEMCCSPNNTGHHLIEDHWVRPNGELMPDFAHLAAKNPNGTFRKLGGPYDGAPTVCVNRSRFHDKHGILHATQGLHEEELLGKALDYQRAKEIALEAHGDAFPNSSCSGTCLESQLDSFYGDDGEKKCHTPDRKQPLKPEQRREALKRKRKLSASGD
jgi:hypothetical protein